MRKLIIDSRGKYTYTYYQIQTEKVYLWLVIKKRAGRLEQKNRTEQQKKKYCISLQIEPKLAIKKTAIKPTCPILSEKRQKIVFKLMLEIPETRK